MLLLKEYYTCPCGLYSIYVNRPGVGSTGAVFVWITGGWLAKITDFSKTINPFVNDIGTVGFNDTNQFL